MLNDKSYQLIEDYLDGTISEADLLLLKSKLPEADFKQQLIFQAELLDGVKKLKEDEIIENIIAEATARKTVQQQGSNNKRNLWPVGIAAGLALLLGAYFLFKMFSVNPSQEIYAEHFNPYPPEVIERGNSETMDALFKDGMKAYVGENYKTALKAFQKIEGNEKIDLFEANCLMQLNQHAQARDVFIDLLNSKDTSIKQNAEWYLSLCYINENNIQRAIDLLNPISQDTEHLFRRDAKAALTRLMSIRN